MTKVSFQIDVTPERLWLTGVVLVLRSHRNGCTLQGLRVILDSCHVRRLNGEGPAVTRFSPVELGVDFD